MEGIYSTSVSRETIDESPMAYKSIEDIVSNIIDTSLDELVAKYGDMPAGVRHAMRMLVDYTYSQQRGSSAESNDIPDAIMTILKLYRTFK